MTNNSKLLSKAREARRVKAASRATDDKQNAGAPATGSSTCSNDIPSSLCLESHTTFVPSKLRGVASAAGTSASSSFSTASTSSYTLGKTVMSFDELKASGALTPRSDPVKKEQKQQVQNSTRPATSPAIGSPSLRGRLKQSVLSGSGSGSDSAGASHENDAAPPFASPTTERTQRAAAKLAARRSSRSASKNSPTGTTFCSPSDNAMGHNDHISASKSTQTSKADLGGEFDREKKGEVVASSRNSTGMQTSPVSFPSPPLSETSRLTSKPSTVNSSGHASSVAGDKISVTAMGPEGRTPLKQLPLSLQREKERKREARKAKSETDPNVESRRNLDKRTARLRYSREFVADLAKHRQLLTSPLPKAGDTHFTTSTSSPFRAEENGVSVYVRKRPIFKYELDRGDFDVVAVDNASASSSQQQRQQQEDSVIISNCVMHSDMRRKLVKPSYFPCTKAFDENCTEDAIYFHIAQPMVQNSVRGGVSTLLMFGQTGSGKSHTMAGIEERAVWGVFEELAACDNAYAVVAVQFVELSGKSCKDLLGDAGEDVILAEDTNGSVKLLNAESIVVRSANELAKAISKGKSRRATEATDVNGVSSRSHAVCQVQITRAGCERRGLLNLLDLAGSERRNDSMYHSSVRQKESTEINASLWALKECVRARVVATSRSTSKKSRNVVIPYRSSNLTRILRESFERDSARLGVIATVAPNATDTEHTIETLRFVSQLVGSEKSIREGESREVVPLVKERKKIELLPKSFTHKQLTSFLKRKKIDVQVPDKFDGKAVMKMSTSQMRVNLKVSASVSSDIFNALRKENDRVSKLHRAERISLAKARKGDYDDDE